MPTTTSDGYEGWAVVEIMGHQRVIGHVSEARIAGTPMLRVDVPSEPPLTQFYGGQAIFQLTPVSEEVARAAAAQTRPPAPVYHYELPQRAEPEDAQVEEEAPPARALRGSADGRLRQDPNSYNSPPRAPRLDAPIWISPPPEPPASEQPGTDCEAPGPAATSNDADIPF